MGTALLIAKLLLAAIFAVAAVAKLADLPGSRQAMREFGVPARLVGALGTLLPLAELLIAVALVPAATSPFAAIGALALLMVFVAAITNNLARGRAPDCHCFGQLQSSPVGWPTLARTVTLAAVAGFVAWRGFEDSGLSAVGWLAHMSTRDLVGIGGLTFLLSLVAGGTWFGWQLFQQHGRLLLRLDELEGVLVQRGFTMPRGASEPQPARGLPVGTEAADFVLPDIHGDEVTLESLRSADKPLLLVFSDPACGPCRALMPQVGVWQRDHADRLTIAVVSQGSLEDNRAESEQHAVSNVVLQHDRKVAESYRAAGTPSAVLIDAAGRIASPLLVGADAIEGFVGDAVSTRLPIVHVAAAEGNRAPVGPNGPAGGKLVIGERAPPFALADLNGKPIRLEDFRGRPTLVLFWNPACGFCQQMLGELRAWENGRPANAPSLVVISGGTVESNRGLGLRSPVIVDESSRVMHAMGATGTPMGVLLDGEGRVASDMTAGAARVLPLLRGDAPAATAAAAVRV